MHGPDNSPGEPAEGAGIEAVGLGLKGPRGWAFRDVSVTAGPGSLIAVEGPSGSGRTTLLLALTGRMRTTEGTATVGGAPLPRRMAAVRAMSGLAHVPEVNDLEPALTVGEHLRERALLQRRFGGPVRALLHPREHSAAVRRHVDEAVAAAGLDLDALPKGARTAVRDLERLEELRLSVALALVGRPRLLAVDDTDLKLSDTDRARVWDLLRSVAASGTTVLAVCSEPPPGSVGAIVVSTGDTRTAESGGTTTTPATPSTPTGLRRSGKSRARTIATTGSRPPTKRTETHPTTARTNSHPTPKQPATATTHAPHADTNTDTDTDTEEVTDAHVATGRA